jgi:hypothetical protein
MQRSWYGCAIVAGVALAFAISTGSHLLPGQTTAARGGAGNYLFCFWNVENLFDDQDDDRKSRGDTEFDNWFARDKGR